MSILNIKNLTMRFGGLTAVSGLDLSVERGQVFSIIGPNGAGKTTVFNAVTGIYEPSDGTIAVAGRVPSRPLTWKVLLACVLVGLATGVAAVLFAINIDLLWRASVKRNMAEGADKFTYAAAARDAWGYLWADLGVEKQRNRWVVVTADGKQSLATAPSEEEARRFRDELAEKIARDESEDFAQIVRDQAGRKRLVWIVFALGISLGMIGSLAVWRRSRRTPEVIARAGIARTFQNIRLFQNMTVLENVLVGTDRYRKASAGVVSGEWSSPRTLLDFVGLAGRSEDLAKDLPYGDQRRLEIARALATGPQLLLLDEPAAGMNPTEAAELVGLIRRIKDQGVTVLLIEHHMNVVMDISDRIAVLDYGIKIAEGTPAEVRVHPKVIEAYLGKEEVA